MKFKQQEKVCMFMLKREKFLLWMSQSSKLIMGIEILIYVIIEINNIHSVD